jgi:DNA gyrase/topoisomerase IV subunit A
LFGQGRGVDDQRILATGLGDQRDIAMFAAAIAIMLALGQGAVDQLRHFGGTGKDHALDAHIRGQCGTHGLAPARQQLQRSARHARFMQQLYGAMGDQRGLLGRLGQHDVAGGQRSATSPMKIASGKFHGLMQTTGPQRQHVAVVTRGNGVVAQEVDRLAHLGNGVGQRLAGFAHGQAISSAYVLPAGRRRVPAWQRARRPGRLPLRGIVGAAARAV